MAYCRRFVRDLVIFLRLGVRGHFFPCRRFLNRVASVEGSREQFFACRWHGPTICVDCNAVNDAFLCCVDPGGYFSFNVNRCAFSDRFVLLRGGKAHFFSEGNLTGCCLSIASVVFRVDANGRLFRCLLCYFVSCVRVSAAERVGVYAVCGGGLAVLFCPVGRALRDLILRKGNGTNLFHVARFHGDLFVAYGYWGRNWARAFYRFERRFCSVHMFFRVFSYFFCLFRNGWLGGSSIAE